MKLALSLLVLLFMSVSPAGTRTRAAESPSGVRKTEAKVYVLPIRSEIAPPLVYLVRRGVKAAMDARADLLVLDMETNGGRVDVTEEIIEILNQFPGETVTYVNRKAFSAGAFIGVATKKIFMAPQSVIGAAAPMLMMPGAGPSEMPETVEAKMTSGISALVRANAEKNGYNVDVIEAMIDKSKRLELDGEVLNEKGQILTLTNLQAEKEYGDPPRPLLSSGTVASLDALIERLGYRNASRVDIIPTGAEKVATWINMISPLLLIIGAIGLYIEFKTPGFGIPGIVGLTALTAYFLGGYIAGLSGMEWIALFLLGLVLIALELFVFPGNTIAGLAGAGCVLLAIIMAMVDIYPAVPNVPAPLSVRIRVPWNEIMNTLLIAFSGSVAAIWGLSRVLPRTPLYHTLVSEAASGEGTLVRDEKAHSEMVGAVGLTTSVLRPGGKAQFGDAIIDVVSQGEMIEKGARVKVLRFSGHEAVVEAV